MQLPPRANDRPIDLPDDVRQITVIGANGSGKTRFTEYLALQLDSKAFRLSALEAIGDAIGGRPHDDTSIDAIYEEANATGTFLHAGEQTTFERLMVLLLNEEIANLVDYKMRLARFRSNPEGDEPRLPQSKLDTVIARWREIFPEHHVMREGGSLLFTRKGDTEMYRPSRLSHGEKATLFYIGSILYAPANGVIFVDNPGMFLHNSILGRFWNTIEAMRPDCRFVYTTHDVDFAASRAENAIVWVRSYNPDTLEWDYDLLPSDSGLSEDLYMALVGSRRPVLFIEGDSTHSIDAKLYPLVFRDFSVKSLGSCNKVIEATRAFNDLRAFHHLESFGIVDRDRRDEQEVEYLRGKHIFVPEVAEIENILMLEDVVKAMARAYGRDPEKVFSSVKSAILAMFRHDLRQQALLHTRHRVKRTLEYRVDGRFNNINALEEHMNTLVSSLNPRGLYEQMCRQFSQIAGTGDYAGVLRYYNQKSMVPGSNVGQMLGLKGSKDAYVQAVLGVMKSESPHAEAIRRAIMKCFGIERNPEL